jgi:hypothetical protein
MFSQYVAGLAILLIIAVNQTMEDREVRKTNIVRLGLAVYFVESLRVMIT